MPRRKQTVGRFHPMSARRQGVCSRRQNSEKASPSSPSLRPPAPGSPLPRSTDRRVSPEPPCEPAPPISPPPTSTSPSNKHKLPVNPPTKPLPRHAQSPSGAGTAPPFPANPTGQAPIPPQTPIRPQTGSASDGSGWLSALSSPKPLSSTQTPTRPKPLSRPKLLSHPSSYPAPGPRKNAKNPAHTPRSAGPAPTASTEFPDASGQSLEGRVRKMIPAPVCGAGRPEVLAAVSIIRHRCDTVNTLVGGITGFFCHSAINEERGAPALTFRSKRPRISRLSIRPGSGRSHRRSGPRQAPRRGRG